MNPKIIHSNGLLYEISTKASYLQPKKIYRYMYIVVYQYLPLLTSSYII